MAPISNTHRPLLGRDSDSDCQGWSCYNSSQQIGIVFMAIVVPVVVGLVFWFGLIKPNIAYWKRVSREAKQRQEMEQQVREDALRQLSSSTPPARPPPEPPREQTTQEQPQQTPNGPSPADAPPCESSSPAKSQQAPAGSPLKLPPASEAPRDSSPVADDVPFINSPKSIQSQSPKVGLEEEVQSPAAKVQPSDQKTQAETGFQWGEHIPESLRPHFSAKAPMMPFPPFPPLQQQEKQQHWPQHQYLPGSTLRHPFPQPSFHPFISVLPPPPPPPRFAAACQQMPGSFPAPHDQPVYHPPPQPTYAPSSHTATDKEQQTEAPASLTTKSMSFPKFLFSRPRQTALPPRSFTESDLGPERMPSGDRCETSVSPMALPSETSSGNNSSVDNNRHGGRETEDERRGRNRHDDARNRERRYARSEHSLESQHSGNRHGRRRHSSGRRRHGARHSPHPERKHERRRARRESSRSCSPDHRRYVNIHASTVEKEVSPLTLSLQLARAPKGHKALPTCLPRTTCTYCAWGLGHCNRGKSTGAAEAATRSRGVFNQT